jgi:hypothetical protein
VGSSTMERDNRISENLGRVHLCKGVRQFDLSFASTPNASAAIMHVSPVGRTVHRDKHASTRGFDTHSVACWAIFLLVSAPKRHEMYRGGAPDTWR